MIKKTLTYVDFDGTEKTDELYFHLTELEATELALELPDGLLEDFDGGATINHVMEKLGRKGILAFVKQMALKSYGVKTQVDGRVIFKKSEKITEDFANTMAFSALIMELMRNDAEAAEFVNGIMPAETTGKNESEQ